MLDMLAGANGDGCGRYSDGCTIIHCAYFTDISHCFYVGSTKYRRSIPKSNETDKRSNIERVCVTRSLQGIDYLCGETSCMSDFGVENNGHLPLSELVYPSSIVLSDTLVMI